MSQRLCSPFSLALINAALRSAQQEGSKRYSDLISTVEALGARKYVSRLIPSSHNNPVEPRILDFQTRYANVLRYHCLRPVRPQTNPMHERFLDEIWHAGRLDLEEGSNVSSPRVSMQDYESTSSRTWDGWRRMGLAIDYVDATDPLSETELFRSVGELGLECLVGLNLVCANPFSITMQLTKTASTVSCSSNLLAQLTDDVPSEEPAQSVSKLCTTTTRSLKRLNAALPISNRLCSTSPDSTAWCSSSSFACGRTRSPG